MNVYRPMSPGTRSVFATTVRLRYAPNTLSSWRIRLPQSIPPENRGASQACEVAVVLHLQGGARADSV